MSNYESFYTEQYEKNYCNTIEMKKHPFFPEISKWLGEHSDMKNKKFLEIGSGRGALQDLVEDYVGMDLSKSVEPYYHKPFVQASAENIPFDDNMFDVVWSHAVWEHIPDPAKAFEETVRVLKNGGHFLLNPAWHCRPWASEGYQVRPYSDFGLGGKIYKFLIPFLDTKLVVGLDILLYRFYCLIRYIFSKKPYPLYFRKLKANYEVFWISDSDACNNLDAYMVIQWFESRGCKCVSHPTFLQQFLIGGGTIDIQISKME